MPDRTDNITSDQPTDRHDFGPAVARLERWTEWPLLVLSLTFVIAFVVGYLPGIPAEVRLAAEFAEYVIVAVFAVDLTIKLAVAEQKLRSLRAHWIDVAIVVLPFLGPLRFLRFLRLLPFLVRSLISLRRVMGHYGGTYILLLGLIAVFVCATLVTIFEAEGEGSIKNFGDAIWWAFTTITTVGYGDMTPVTPEGRAVAIFLMLIGIAIFGTVTAAIAAFFVETKEANADTTVNAALLGRMDDLEQRIIEQHHLIRTLINRQEEQATRVDGPDHPGENAR